MDLKSRLRPDEKRAYELARYDLSVTIGSLTMVLSAYESRLPGVLISPGPTSSSGTDELATDRPMLTSVPQIGCLLLPGEIVTIGREIGIQVTTTPYKARLPERDIFDLQALNDLVLGDRYISRSHARIGAWPEHIVEVEDLGTSNGTFVERIDKPNLQE